MHSWATKPSAPFPAAPNALEYAASPSDEGVTKCRGCRVVRFRRRRRPSATGSITVRNGSFPPSSHQAAWTARKSRSSLLPEITRMRAVSNLFSQPSYTQARASLRNAVLISSRIADSIGERWVQVAANLCASRQNAT